MLKVEQMMMFRFVCKHLLSIVCTAADLTYSSIL